MIMYDYYECVRICRSSSSFTFSLHTTDFAATIDSFCLPTLTLTAIIIAPYIADRIISIIIMRINILAVAAIVQLSSLPFASANHCWKSLDDYHCGAGYQEDGYFDINPDTNECICCCRDEDGSGYHEQTCDGGNIKSLDKGCGSCMGEKACNGASNSKIGDKSCVNKYSCRDMTGSFIKEYSCRAIEACEGMQRSHVGTHSCGIGQTKREACYYLSDSTVGDNSCQEDHSCSIDNDVGTGWTRRLSTDEGVGSHLKIGNNACNMNYVCSTCENYSVVPDGACNGGDDTSDITNSYCNYCKVSTSSTALRALIFSTLSTQRTFPLVFKPLNNHTVRLPQHYIDCTVHCHEYKRWPPFER
jgi:hypothetical protein